jgi:hypothetical protein
VTGVGFLLSFAALGLAGIAFGWAVLLLLRGRRRGTSSTGSGSAPGSGPVPGAAPAAELEKGLPAVLRKRATERIADLIFGLLGLASVFAWRRLLDTGPPLPTDIAVVALTVVTLVLVAFVRPRRAAAGAAAIGVLAMAAVVLGVADDRPCDLLGPAVVAATDGPGTEQVVPVPSFAVAKPGKHSPAPSPDKNLNPPGPPSTPRPTLLARTKAPLESCRGRVAG